MLDEATITLLLLPLTLTTVEDVPAITHHCRRPPPLALAFAPWLWVSGPWSLTFTFTTLSTLEPT